MKRVPLSMLAQWVMDSWLKVSDDVVVHAFKKCGLCNASDGTEDDTLWNKSDKENGSKDNGDK